MTDATDGVDVLTIVLSALHKAGWHVDDQRGAAVARKPFKTVNVEDTALAFLSNGDGYNQTLSFQFISEGANKTATDSALIPIGATAALVHSLALNAASNAEASIRDSFAVRMA